MIGDVIAVVSWGILNFKFQVGVLGLLRFLSMIFQGVDRAFVVFL